MLKLTPFVVGLVLFAFVSSEIVVFINAEIECSSEILKEKKLWCAGIYYHDDTPEFGEDFGHVEARCTLGNSLISNVTFPLNYAAVGPKFVVGAHIYHNCSYVEETVWLSYGAKYFENIFEISGPTFYSLDVTNKFSDDAEDSYINDRIDNGNEITDDFQVIGVNGHAIDDDEAFRRRFRRKQY